MKPPQWAEQLLLRRLAVDERDELIGDINEQFARRAELHGAASARRWYWRQTLALLWGFSLHRRDVISIAHERTRGAWATGNLMTDLRYAWRSLRHSRSFAVVALLTLTFGIGLSTAVFSLVSGILVSPLPYAHPEALVRIGEFDAKQTIPVSGGSVTDTAIGLFLSRAQSLAAFSPYDSSGLTVTLPDGPANTIVADVGPQFFSVLSAPPLTGRLLGESDGAPNAAPAVLISQRLWTTAYRQRTDITNAALQIDTIPYSIAGVLPSTFAWPSADVDVWRIGPDYPKTWPAPGRRRMFQMHAEVIARLKPGASIADVDRDGASIAMQIATSDPAFSDGTVEPTRIRARRLLDDVVAPVKPALLVLGAGMGLVLLAGCVNLANLLLARHTARQRELAVRIALGASRWRVARPVLLELMLLGGAGGAAGGLLAWWTLRALPLIAPTHLPRLEGIHFDARSLLFATAVSILTAVVVGLLPVLQMPSTDVREVVSAGGRLRIGGVTRSADRLRGLLVVGQISLAVTLLVGALLIGRSLSALLHVNPGYHPDGIISFEVGLPVDVYKQKGRQSSYYNQMLERIARHPAVVAAGYTQTLPMHQITHRSSVNIEGKPVVPVRDPAQMAVSVAISANYLATLGTRIVKGRGFTPMDTLDGLKVVLIDEALERKFFAGENPIGQRLRGPGAQFWTVIGVVEAVHLGPLSATADPTIYYHTEQLSEILAYSSSGSGIAVKTTGDPRALASFLRAESQSVDATAPIYHMRTLNDELGESVAQPRFFAVVLALFAALALSTALLGIYGVLAYSVERRHMEFGVRRALGATERHVMSLVTKQALMLALSGLVLGLGLAAGGARLMRAILFGVTPADPFSYIAASALVLSVVLAATWQPVRRALRIDPARALRVD